jgi:hypothetical protein
MAAQKIDANDEEGQAQSIKIGPARKSGQSLGKRS